MCALPPLLKHKQAVATASSAQFCFPAVTIRQLDRPTQDAPTTARIRVSGRSDSLSGTLRHGSSRFSLDLLSTTHLDISSMRPACSRRSVSATAAVPRMKQILGHNHITQVFHIGTTDESISADLLAF